MKKPVTIRYIRFENKKEKVTMDNAIDLIKNDPSHAKYTRDQIQNALEKGVLIQLENTTLQMPNMGYDFNPKIKIKEEEEEN